MSNWQPIQSYVAEDLVEVDLYWQVPPAFENYEVGRQGRMTGCYRRDERWFHNPRGIELEISVPITHWMPVPEAPPKEAIHE